MSSKYIEVGVRGSSFRSIDSHTGVDGRYELFEGQTRNKWNNYDMLRMEAKSVPGSTGNYSVTYDPITVSSGILAPPSLGLKVDSRLLQKVKEHSFDLGVALAEGKQAMGLLRHSVDSIAQAVGALRRGSKADAARILLGARGQTAASSKSPRSRIGRTDSVSLGDVRQSWLELQFGWLPLLSDIHEAFSAYSALTDPPRVDRVRASARSHYTQDINLTYYVLKCRVAYRRYVLYEMTEHLETARQLGLLDPTAIAWNLLPNSFLVDWFIPIGTYLENLQQIPMLKGRFLTVDQYETHVYSVLTQKGWEWDNIAGGSTRQELIELKRRATNGLAATYPQLKPMDTALSPRHIADAIALLGKDFH